MILGFKQQFPWDMSPTNFKEKIISGEKIHSMREGSRWKIGMTIQMAYGVRTKFYDQFNKENEALQRVVSIQQVRMDFDDDGMLSIAVDGDFLDWEQKFLLMKNDGLTESQFYCWFFPGDKRSWKGQIIHWTNHRY